MSRQWKKADYWPNPKVPGPVWYRTVHGRRRVATLRVYETLRSPEVHFVDLRERGLLWTWVVYSFGQKAHYGHTKTKGEAKAAASCFARKLLEVAP